jgi:hypothetical protein
MIEAPKWAKDAVPTTRGWAKGNEVLIVRKFSQEEINEWYAAQAPEPKVTVQPVDPLPELTVDDPVIEEVTPTPLKATKVKKKTVL